MAEKSKQAEEGRDLLRVAFGEVLREYRRQIKPRVRQAVLSARAGLPSNAIGDLERGERTIKAGELKSICKVLGVTVKVFMDKVQRAQLKALGESEPAGEGVEEAAAARAPDQLYLTLALAGRNVEDVIRMVHRMINASAPNPEDEG